MQKRDEEKKERKKERGKEKKKNRINGEKVTRDNWINTKLTVHGVSMRRQWEIGKLEREQTELSPSIFSRRSISYIRELKKRLKTKLLNRTKRKFQ